MSQDATPQPYQIGPFPDAAINGFFEGHTEAKTNRAPVFLWEGVRINTGLACVALHTNTWQLPLVLDLALGFPSGC